MDVSKLANQELRKTKPTQQDSTQEANTKSELSINTIKGIQADLNELFKGKGETVFIFSNLKEYTNKAPQKNETQYLYKLSKKTILYYEFNKKNVKKTMSFNIASFKFKEQKLNDKPHFIQEFLI